MKKLFMLLTLVAGVATFTNAQYLEGGIFLGGANYSGDLSDRTFDATDVELAYGLVAKYNINDYLTVAARLSQGTLSGADADSRVEARRSRNLSFSSPITEFSITPEFNIFGFNAYDRLFSPYVYAGLAFFRFNPQAFYEGQWYDLQPLGTEGQGISGRPARYELSQMSFPIGMGLKYSVAEYWTVGLEFGSRITLTDYLDDVSGEYVPRDELILNNGVIAANLANRMGEFLGTEPVITTPGAMRANPDIKDWYSFFGVSLTYNFLDGFGGNKYGCPTNF